MRQEDYYKVDYSSGKNEVKGKCAKLLLRTKGRLKPNQSKKEYVKMWY